MPVGLGFAQNSINQNDNRIILDIFVYRFLAGFLKRCKNNIRISKLRHSEILGGFKIAEPLPDVHSTEATPAFM